MGATSCAGSRAAWPSFVRGHAPFARDARPDRDSPSRRHPGSDAARLSQHVRFVPLGLADFPSKARADAQAFVRDDSLWSQLVPADDGPSRYVLFRFHFPEGVDNSGFVGWLASLIKRETGAGTFVVCGENRTRGGIFDLWGVDLQVGAEVLSIVQSLRVASPAGSKP